MKKLSLILILIIATVAINKTYAQSSGISKKLGVYIFPSNNQDSETQEADEAACYKWAMEQTDYDPLNPPIIETAPVDTSPDGSAIKGAAGGAAGGAAIGAITGNAGDGAAVGAIMGGIRGIRAKRNANAAQKQANINAAANYSAELLNNYKKAFSACMEGKGYTVK
jgi:hypothetical protein